eukprot:TRINITY_DN14990_c0_g1_i1.p1 TRINITY_DN14990_c0_g1~~TRINITY_DN14990_c0_g1_i1.p1  ORF type:complete len:945 (+),score=372.52 TRINITY_DN14990_c0_g1_i1:85-2919(+)
MAAPAAAAAVAAGDAVSVGSSSSGARGAPLSISDSESDYGDSYSEDASPQAARHRSGSGTSGSRSSRASSRTLSRSSSSSYRYGARSSQSTSPASTLRSVTPSKSSATGALSCSTGLSPHPPGAAKAVRGKQARQAPRRGQKAQSRSGSVKACKPAAGKRGSPRGGEAARRKGLEYSALPDKLRAPQDRYAYPEPIVPFPPLLASPYERKKSVELKRQQVERIQAQNLRYQVKSGMLRHGEGAVNLQHALEWEATQRMTIEWEQVKDARRLEAVWAKYNDRRTKDIKAAVEQHLQREHLARVRLEKEAFKIFDGEDAGRGRVEKQRAKAWEGLEKAWERVVLQHLCHAEVLIQQARRKRAKAAAEFLRVEGAARNDVLGEEKLARVAVQRAIGKTLTQVKHDQLLRKVREDKQKQRSQGQGKGDRGGWGLGAARDEARTYPAVRGGPSSLALYPPPPSLPPLAAPRAALTATPSSAQAPRPHIPTRSVSEIREEHDQGHWEALYATLINKEALHRARHASHEESDFGVVVFRHDKAVQVYLAAQRQAAAQYWKDRRVAEDTALAACAQAEADQRARLDLAAAEGLKGLIRHEQREAVRRRRHEASIVKKEGIHKRKIAAQRGKAAREQETYVATAKQTAQQHHVVLCEHHARDALAAAQGAKLAKLKTAEHAAALHAFAAAEARVRRKLGKAEAAARGAAKVKARQEGAFVENCTMSLESLVQRHVTSVKHHHQAHLHHLETREGVERQAVVKEEDGARGVLYKACRGEHVDAAARSAEAVERRGKCHENLAKLRKAQAASREAQAAVAAARAEEARERDRGAFAAKERQLRGAIRTEERHAFSRARLEYLKAEAAWTKAEKDTAERALKSSPRKRQRSERPSGAPARAAPRAGVLSDHTQDEDTSAAKIQAVYRGRKGREEAAKRRAAALEGDSDDDYDDDFD